MEKLKNKTVLIVDDEERNVFALRSYLEEIVGIKIETAANGKDAIEMMESKGRPDLILLDMMMPVMDGYETLEALKKMPALKHIPVIAVTAKAMKGDKEKCMEAGAWDYIPKPVDMQLLIDKLNRWIL